MDTILSLSDSLDTPTFYGVNNRNMLCLKNQHPDVRVVARGCQVKITGPDKAVERFEHALHLCEDFCIRNNRLSEQDILLLLHGDKPQEQATDNLILHGVNGKSILARSANQQQLFTDFQSHDLLFAVGPAGSGKTYVAIALAVRALKNKETKRIILSRPAVEAGEKLGFLPGDMREKIDPYLQPLYDALQDMIPAAKLEEYMEKTLPAGQIWNINIPDCPADECRGIRRNAVMNTEHFYDDQYLKEEIGRKTWSVTNIARRIWKGPENSDLNAVIRKYISVGTVTNLT